MGDRAASTVVARRPRWRTYLRLARISNLPTIWTNVLAGTVGAQLDVEASVFVRTLVAMSLFYTAGMFLNDAFDADFDRRHQPHRPIPSAEVSKREVMAVGVGLLALGEALLAPNAAAMLLGALLGALIVWYDVRHKGNPLAVLLMGGCRALVYIVAGVQAGGVSPQVAAGAAAVGAYVAGLTLIARATPADSRRVVPVLIAGIALVDAAFIGVVSGSIGWMAAAAAGFAATLFLQRYVAGD